jgi:hypothetical protein
VVRRSRCALAAPEAGSLAAFAASHRGPPDGASSLLMQAVRSVRSSPPPLSNRRVSPRVRALSCSPASLSPDRRRGLRHASLSDGPSPGLSRHPGGGSLPPALPVPDPMLQHCLTGVTLWSSASSPSFSPRCREPSDVENPRRFRDALSDLLRSAEVFSGRSPARCPAPGDSKSYAPRFREWGCWQPRLLAVSRRLPPGAPLRAPPVHGSSSPVSGHSHRSRATCVRPVQLPCGPLTLRFTSVGLPWRCLAGAASSSPSERRPARPHRCARPSPPRRFVVDLPAPLSGHLGFDLSASHRPCRPLRPAATVPRPPTCVGDCGPPCVVASEAHAGHTFACGLRARFGLPRRGLARTAAAVGVSLVAGPERRLPPVACPGLGPAGEPWLSGAPKCVLRSVFRSTLPQLRGVAPAASRPVGLWCAETSSTSSVRSRCVSALSGVVRSSFELGMSPSCTPLPVVGSRRFASAPLTFRPPALWSGLRSPR